MKVIIILATFAIAIAGSMFLYREYYLRDKGEGTVASVKLAETEKSGSGALRPEVGWQEEDETAGTSLFEEIDERIIKTRVEWIEGEGSSSIRTVVEWLGEEGEGYLFRHPEGKVVKTMVDWIEQGGPGSVRTRVEWLENENSGELFRQ